MDAHAKPPQPGSAEHWALWLEKYGDDYATDTERRDAYQEFRTNLTTIQEAFSQPDDMHAAGYLAAQERVSDGDAESSDDAELWVPADLSGPARANWLEGFRSHFEPTTSAPIETCDCPHDHYRSMDGRCKEPSLRSEEPEALARYSWCGCCMADCPDVHAEPGSEFLAVPGSVLVAAEYVATLHPGRQRDLREQEARGELRIVPRAQMHE